MTTSMKRPVYLTAAGEALEIAPGTETPVSVDEMIKRRDSWREKYGHLLDGYSVAEYLREKGRDIEKGLE